MSGTASQTEARTILHHWRDNIFGFDGEMLKWFNAQGFSRIQDFIFLEDEDIDDIEYVDSNGNTNKAPWIHRIMFKAAIGYFHYDRYHNKFDIVDATTSADVTNQEKFDKFYTEQYDPTKPIIKYSDDYVHELERDQAREEREVELHNIQMKN
jgi:hypothetical protein